MKGALMSSTTSGKLTPLVTFQYNPEQLTRSLKPNYLQGESGKLDQLRFGGAPTEQITASIVLDATDALASDDDSVRNAALTRGIHAPLAALATLIYPTSEYVQKVDQARQSKGTLQVVPPAAPPLLFVWGYRRIAPVKIESISIKEEAYDTALNPIRATVDLSMSVLTYMDVEVGTPAYSAFLTYQQCLESLAGRT